MRDNLEMSDLSDFSDVELDKFTTASKIQIINTRRLSDSILQIKETTPVEIYAYFCEKYSARPWRQVWKAFENAKITHKFDIANFYSGKKSFKVIAKTIAYSKIILEAKLSSNMLCGKAINFLSKYPSSSLIHLDLSNNPIGLNGCLSIEKILRENGPLKELILSDNEISDRELIVIVRGICENSMLNKLDLSKNRINSKGALELTKALNNLSSLRWLSLCWNQIFGKTTTQICVNFGYSSLEFLDLSWNGLGDAGALGLMKALIFNQTIQDLYLVSNRIGYEGIVSISDALLFNSSLRKLRLGLNPVTVSGVLKLLANIYKSETTRIELLEMEGLVIHDRIVKIVETINEIRPLKIIYSHCVKFSKNFVQKEERNAFVILGDYLSAHMLRIVDLFRVLDRGNQGYLTRDQIIAGMQKMEIPLTHLQMKEIAEYLDTDKKNEITYHNRLRLYKIEARDLERLKIKNKDHKKLNLDQMRVKINDNKRTFIENAPFAQANGDNRSKSSIYLSKGSTKKELATGRSRRSESILQKIFVDNSMQKKKSLSISKKDLLKDDILKPKKLSKIHEKDN